MPLPKATRSYLRFYLRFSPGTETLSHVRRHLAPLWSERKAARTLALALVYGQQSHTSNAVQPGHGLAWSHDTRRQLVSHLLLTAWPSEKISQVLADFDRRRPQSVILLSKGEDQ